MNGFLRGLAKLILRLVGQFYIDEGEAEQRAQDKAAADALEAQYQDIARRPLSVGAALERLRKRAGGH